MGHPEKVTAVGQLAREKQAKISYHRVSYASACRVSDSHDLLTHSVVPAWGISNVHEVKCLADEEDFEGMKGLVFAEGSEGAIGLVMHLHGMHDVLGAAAQVHGPCKGGLFALVSPKTSWDNWG